MMGFTVKPAVGTDIIGCCSLTLSHFRTNRYRLVEFINIVNKTKFAIGKSNVTMSSYKLYIVCSRLRIRNPDGMSKNEYFLCCK